MVGAAMQGRAFEGGIFRCFGVAAAAAVVLAAVALAGCGGGGGSGSASTAAAVPSSPAASTQGAPASKADTVASVSSTPIDKPSYEHWLAVERALGATGSPSHKALAFLISSDWVIGEATARGISVSEAEVKQRLAQYERQSFPKAGSLHKFYARSHETEADLLARVKVELLESAIAAKVAAGKSGSERAALLSSFQRAFQRHWKSYTSCKAGYVMEYCADYHGKPEDLAVSSSSTARSRGSAATSSSGAAPAGTVNAPPGSFSITSSAFANGAALPAQYTCDGANVSPPLQWSNLPAKTAALVLFVIDDSTSGSAGGIRWIVGDIDPSSKGVAAGKTPAGGIVGANAAQQSNYGGICPPRGKSSSVEFVLYPLRKKIPLTTGFQAAVAEHDYGAGNLLLGSAAVSYATYHRP
jgi:phosphatidylethanolamine-binding protein (PEBP) family uncharacterized protein